MIFALWARVRPGISPARFYAIGARIPGVMPSMAVKMRAKCRTDNPHSLAKRLPGGNDRVSPASMVEANFKLYLYSMAVTQFKACLLPVLVWQANWRGQSPSPALRPPCRALQQILSASNTR